MAFREVAVFEVREVLRAWLRGEGLRSVASWRGWTARPSAVTSHAAQARAWPATAARGS